MKSKLIWHRPLYINWNSRLDLYLSLSLLLYVRYGYHISKNSYFICHDQDVIRSLFERLRSYSGQKDSYPTECGRFSISAVRDLTTGYDSNQPDNKAVSARTDTLTFPQSAASLWRLLYFCVVLYRMRFLTFLLKRVWNVVSQPVSWSAEL